MDRCSFRLGGAPLLGTALLAASCFAQTRPYLVEQAIPWDSSVYTNVWEQVDVSVTLISPSAKLVRIGGFYYGPNTWKFRFAPNEPGQWTWQATITDGNLSGGLQGHFTVDSALVNRFVRQSSVNTLRWALTDGTPYYPVGINDCVFNRKADANEIDPEGPIRFWLDQQIVEKEQFFGAFGNGGVNLFRWGPDNCAVSLYDTIAPEGNVYREADASRVDDMLRAAQDNNLRVYQVLFGFNPPYSQQPTAEQMNAVKRYLKYMVDRYGALVDFWELMNEARASDVWYDHAILYLHQIDPYQHPISTSFEYPTNSGIQINSPHWYQSEPEQDSDLITSQNLSVWQSLGKPVIVGEQGNTTRSWDEGSALRMRLRLWTAMFSQGALTFWNSSRFLPEIHADGGVANIYLGPQERSFMRVLEDFSRHVPADAFPCSVEVPSGIRGYCLGGNQSVAVYLHHFVTHQLIATGQSVWLQVPRPGTLAWIRPDTGELLARQDVVAGWQQLLVPDFLVDVSAFLL